MTHADGLAVDWISDKLYYLNSCDRRIEVLDLASYDRMILASDIYTQLYRSNIIVDPTTRYIIIKVYSFDADCIDEEPLCYLIRHSASYIHTSGNLREMNKLDYNNNNKQFVLIRTPQKVHLLKMKYHCLKHINCEHLIMLVLQMALLEL